MGVGEQFHSIDASLSSKQYGLKAAIKVFQTEGLTCMASEIRDNLHGRGVIKPVIKHQVNWKIQKESLPYLMFLKQKGYGIIKACRCPDGRKQQEFISKKEVSLPTVSIYALMVKCLSDTIEGLYVIPADIPGALLRQADMDKDVWIRFEE